MIESGTTIVRVQDDIAAQAEQEPAREEEHLGRDARGVLVADLAEQGEVEPA